MAPNANITRIYLLVKMRIWRRARHAMFQLRRRQSPAERERRLRGFMSVLSSAAAPILPSSRELLTENLIENGSPIWLDDHHRRRRQSPQAAEDSNSRHLYTFHHLTQSSSIYWKCHVFLLQAEQRPDVLLGKVVFVWYT